MTEALNPELLRKLLRYEPETGKLFWRNRPREMFATQNSFGTWNTRSAGKEAFTAINSDGYFHGTIFKVHYRAHRVAWAITHGQWPQGQVDHINGDASDNRIENLRVASCSENQKNTKISKNNTSGHNGVSWHKASRKWRVQITIDGKRKQVGVFDILDEAIIARKLAEEGQGYTERHGK